MAKRMLIDALHPEETRIVIADENQIYDFDFVSSSKKQLKGNIYLAKITRVEPSLQAAFVEYGGGKQGFLPFSEIHPDYYQIPVSDRKRLMEEAAAEADDAPEPLETASSSTEEPAANDFDTDLSANESLESTPLPLAPAIEEIPISDTDETPESQSSYMQEAASDTSISEDAPLPEQLQYNQSDNAEEFSSAAEKSFESAAASDSRSDESPAEDVETLQNEEEEIQSRPKKTFSKRYKIQEVIRRGQIVLIQVIKEERGNKGASLTTFLSLAGRYCVLMPNSPKDGGISRKIASADDRKRLKAISAELRLAAGISVIIRTAGMDRTRAEIKRDYDYLVKLWNRIREDTLKSNAPALIYEESDLIKRAIRDQYSNDIDEVIIEGDEGYRAGRDFMKLLLPSHTPKIKHYKEMTPLFYAYNIEDQLLSMHDPVVKLKSGGYIVINPTEALISIDVNSGRATGERNIEETASKTNLEAAAEVARQLRLRDLAGLIVIDFIDMLESRNRRAVEKAIKDALKVDRAKIQLGRISPFGLMEMSRQRLRPSISETNMVQCPHCVGRGYIRSNESMSIQMIRALEKEASTGNWNSLRLMAPQAVALHLLNSKRDSLRSIEERYNITIQVLIDLSLATSDYNLEKMRRSGAERTGSGNDNRRGGRGGRNERPRQESTPIQAETVLGEMDEMVLDISADGEVSAPDENAPREERFGRPSRNRGRRGRRGSRLRGERNPNTTTPAGDEFSAGDNVVEISDHQAAPSAPRENREAGDGSQRPPRQRGGRGRRNWRDRPPRDNQTNNTGTQESWTSGDAGERSSANGAHSEAPALPAFATQEPVFVDPTPPLFRNAPVQKNVAPVAAPAPRDPAAPPKKGWWQKMIDLD